MGFVERLLAAGCYISLDRLPQSTML